jgi:hypothetical protein
VLAIWITRQFFGVLNMNSVEKKTVNNLSLNLVPRMTFLYNVIQPN